MNKEKIISKVIHKVKSYNKALPKYMRKFLEKYYEKYFDQIDKDLKIKIVKAVIDKDDIEIHFDIKGGEHKYSVSADYKIKHLDMSINGRHTGVNTWTDVFKKVIKREEK